MDKYFAIINFRTMALIALSLLLTFLCLRFNFGYDLNITLFSIAVIFPLVFTIREAFKRRDHALRFLSLFKSSTYAVYYCFDTCEKLDDDKKGQVTEILEKMTLNLFSVLRGQSANLDLAHQSVNDVFLFLKANGASIPNRIGLKIIRFLEDVHESIEATNSIKTHGTPVSLRAYCLVFIFVFPFVFTPVIVFNMSNIFQPIIYALSVLHSFILISLYNVQEDMEDPFDQIGLDDIRLDDFHFKRISNQDPTG